ncbi:hypothetical protein B0H13DRAFT_2383585 [Mycena leptocephala]|nr:hypothetical protein B0H13DRAFT_2383585 [Mycena leptocephala]
MAPYRCPSPCGDTFDTKQGWSRHQGTCPFYNAENESEDEDDNVASTSYAKFENMRAQKRRKLAHSNQPSETSSMADEHSDPPPPEDAMMVDDPQPPEAPSPVPSPPPAVSSTGRPVRTKRPTWKLLQLLPEPLSAAPDRGTDPEPTLPPAPSSFVWDSVKSALNSFGLYREYPRAPTHDPDSTISLVDLSDIPRPPAPAVATAPAPSVLLPPAEPQTNPYHPFPNSTAYGITNWMWSGSPLKSIGVMHYHLVLAVLAVRSN